MRPALRRPRAPRGPLNHLPCPRAPRRHRSAVPDRLFGSGASRSPAAATLCLDRPTVLRYLRAAVDEPAGALARARLALSTRAKVTALAKTGPHSAPAGVCLAGLLSELPHDAPRRTRPALRAPGRPAWAGQPPSAPLRYEAPGGNCCNADAAGNVNGMRVRGSPYPPQTYPRTLRAAATQAGGPRHAPPGDVPPLIPGMTRAAFSRYTSHSSW